LEEENGIKELWEKVKAAVKKYFGQRKAELEKLVVKYKPRIIAELQVFEKSLIKEGKTLAVDLLGDLIKIIISGGGEYSDDEPQVIKIAIESKDNSVDAIWQRILDTVDKINGPRKTAENFKPQIMEAIKNKNVVMSCGKDLVIQVIDGVVKVITDGEVSMSDDSNPNEFYFKGDYVMRSFA